MGIKKKDITGFYGLERLPEDFEVDEKLYEKFLSILDSLGPEYYTIVKDAGNETANLQYIVFDSLIAPQQKISKKFVVNEGRIESKLYSTKIPLTNALTTSITLPQIYKKGESNFDKYIGQKILEIILNETGLIKDNFNTIHIPNSDVDTAISLATTGLDFYVNTMLGDSIRNEFGKIDKEITSTLQSHKYAALFIDRIKNGVYRPSTGATTKAERSINAIGD